MQKRKLGYTDLYLTMIGFGAWAIGGPWDFGWGPQDDDESIATIQHAIDLGINWIDTAAAYGLGHSEELVGRVLKGRRERIIVATKCGLVWNDPSELRVFNRLKGWSVRREAEDSLRRLGVDVIDLYFIHWPNPDADVEEAWTEIARLVEEGKIRYAGVSNFSVGQIRRAQAIHPVAALQPLYNILDRGVEAELLGFCAANDIGVVAYSPMASGLLTGKFTRERIAALPADDMRHKKEFFREPELAANLALIEGLRPIAARHGRSVGQLAVAWVLRRPELASAIVGARRPEQIAQIAPAADWTLDEATVAEVEALQAARDRQRE
jgi:aryl-alcohol dehydrogenase-like predicted oxidoreductase